MSSDLWRLQRTLLLGTGAWGLFGVIHLARGWPRSASIDLGMSVGTGLLYLVSRKGGEGPLHNLAHMAFAIAVLGLTCISMGSGQADAIAIGWVVVIPMVAAYQIGARAGATWGKISVAAIIAVYFSHWGVAITPEFRPDALEKTVSRTVLVIIITVFSVYGRQLHERSVQALEAQARELAQVRDQALLASEAKSRFLASMSHEIRTPLNAVVGLTQALATTPLSSEQRSWLETVSRSSELLMGIVDDILDFSKLEAEQVSLEDIPLELERSLFHAADLVAGRAWKKGLDLAVQVDPATPRMVRGDPLRLEQILLNLLSNAIKFTARGDVVVSLAPLPESQGVEFVVRDTGIGIPPDRLDKLFRPFGQMDASISRRFGGTGLGLAISQRLTAMMGGDLKVTSVPYQGSVFTLHLPLQTAEPSPEPPRLAARVTCVGLLKASREALGQMLRPWGVSLVEGEADFVVVDTRATDLEHQLKERSGTRVMLLPVGEEALRAQAGRLGITEWLRFPLRPSGLLSLLRGEVEPEPAALAEPPLGDNHPLRILVVEDNLVNQKVAAVMLRRLGYECDLADHGQIALERVGSGDYDLVLMDLQMPVMDGLEATRRIRAEFGARPQVVVVTADVLPSSREQLAQAGADGFLGKPLTLSELRRALLECPGRPEP